MSRSNFSTSNHPDDPPPSYEDIICSSNATEDRNNPFEEQAKATHTRFINGRVPTIITTQGHTPTAPLCEAIGGGVSQYVIPENMNVSAGTILEVPISDSEYARAREYGRAPSPSPSTHRSTRIAPNVNNTFHSASDDWEEVDRSKLSNAEYRALLARRQRALEDEVRRLDQIEQNAQPAQRPHQTSDDYPYLKPLIVVAFIICSMIYIVCLLIRFAS